MPRTRLFDTVRGVPLIIEEDDITSEEEERIAIAIDAVMGSREERDQAESLLDFPHSIATINRIYRKGVRVLSFEEFSFLGKTLGVINERRPNAMLRELYKRRGMFSHIMTWSGEVSRHRLPNRVLIPSALYFIDRSPEIRPVNVNHLIKIFYPHEVVEGKKEKRRLMSGVYGMVAHAERRQKLSRIGVYSWWPGPNSRADKEDIVGVFGWVNQRVKDLDDPVLFNGAEKDLWISLNTIWGMIEVDRFRKGPSNKDIVLTLSVLAALLKLVVDKRLYAPKGSFRKKNVRDLLRLLESAAKIPVGHISMTLTSKKRSITPESFRVLNICLEALTKFKSHLDEKPKAPKSWHTQVLWNIHEIQHAIRVSTEVPDVE